MFHDNHTCCNCKPNSSINILLQVLFSEIGIKYLRTQFEFSAF